MQFRQIAAVAGSALIGSLAAVAPALAVSINKISDISKLVGVEAEKATFPIFVVGADAKPSDVAAAIGVAANLASNAKVSTAVSVSGAEETVTGGAKIATRGVGLTPYTGVPTVKGIMTASDLDLLKTQTFQTASGGSYQYKQYLYLANDGSTTNSNPTKLMFVRPTDENTPRIAVKAPGTSILYMYKMTFSTPVALSSVTTTGTLQQVIQTTTLSLLGVDFVLSDATWDVTNSRIQDITLLGGKTVASVGTDASKTVTVDNKDYKITLAAVTSSTVGGSAVYYADGDINGQAFSGQQTGSTFTLSDGTKIVVTKVRQGKTGAPDYATFAIGAKKVKIAQAGTVTIEDKTVAELTATLTSGTTTGWSGVTISYTPSIDKYLNTGQSITDPFAGAFDIKFNSISPTFDDATSRQTISLSPSGYNVMLTYKNAGDNEKQMYTLYYDSGTWRWASASAGSPTNADNNYRDVVFDEGQNISAIEQDYFVIQKAGFSHTMQFTSFTPSTSELIFTDEAGNSITASNSSATSADLIVDGNTYKVYVVDVTKKIVDIDLNGDGYIAGGPASTYGWGSGGNTSKEYSFLIPKLITTGQGGLYFYNGGRTGVFADAGTNAWTYPGLGFAGIRLYNSSTNVTVATYSAGTWTNETTLITIPATATAPANANYTKNYIDYFVQVTNRSAPASANYTISIGTDLTNRTAYGLILVEEAQQGSTTHNWVYFPVAYDSTNTRAYVATPVSDDSNYDANAAVLGTATQYKGMTTYGTRVDYLSSTLGGSATISYPDTFLIGNLYVLSPTGTITTGAVAGGTTADKIYPVTTDVAMLDTQVTDAVKSGSDLIIFGGPAINKLSHALLVSDQTTYPYPVYGYQFANAGVPLATDEAIIKVVQDAFASGKTAVIVAGWEARDTDYAARMISEQTSTVAGWTSDTVTLSTTAFPATKVA